MAATRSAWRRLKRNKGAVFGIFVILLSVLCAIFAYFIAPDSSPDANRIIVEIGGRKPGSQQQFLVLPREKEVPKSSFFDRLINGQEDKVQYIPISSYAQSTDSLIIQQYID